MTNAPRPRLSFRSSNAEGADAHKPSEAEQSVAKLFMPAANATCVPAGSNEKLSTWRRPNEVAQDTHGLRMTRSAADDAEITQEVFLSTDPHLKYFRDR